MAVVGNVGTYAQVQPIEGPNFGGMVQAQFDKLDAEKKAKEAAKAKAKKEEQDRIARLGGLGDLKITNINRFNKGLHDAYSQMKDEYVEAERNGDYFTARRLKDSLDTLNNSTQMAINKMSFLEKEADKLDPDFYQRNSNILRSLNDGNTDVKYNKNGQMLFTVYEDAQKTKVLLENMSHNEIVSALDAPYKFSLEGTVNEFTKNYKPSSVESLMKDKISTVKVSDVMNDSNVLNGINNKATELANDSTSLAWYGKTFLNKYETDKNNFSEKEKEEAKEYFRNRILDSYEKEIDLSIQQRRRGGSGGKEDFNFNPPVVFESPYINLGDSTSKPTAEEIKKGVGSNSQFIFTSEEYKKNPVRSITVGKGNTALNVSNMPLDQIVYDPVRKKIFLGISRPIRSSAIVRGNQVSGGVGDSEKETVWMDAKDPKFQAFKANASRVLGTKLETEADVIKYFFLNNL
jgi:hypothetical protein